MRILIVLATGLGGCAGGQLRESGEDGYVDADADSDADSDSDTDSGTGSSTDTGADSDVDIDGDVDADSDSDSDTDTDTGTGTGTADEPPPDVDVSAECGGYLPSTYVADEWEEPELHIIGVYEASGNHAVCTEATVHVERETEMILVLSSYECVSWIVTAEPGANITDVIVNGYEVSSVEVPDGVDVEYHVGVGSYLSACAYAWPGDACGCDTPGLVDDVERITDLTLTSFTGCYQGWDFTLGEG